MADPKDKSEKTIEMRLAELEDKVSKIHITEDEIKAYQKVASLLGGGGAAEAQVDPTMSAAAAPSIQCIIPRQIWRGITPRIARKGIESSEKLGRHRWVVERTHSWLNRFRGILIRWNKKAENYIALLHMAFSFIIFRQMGFFG